MAEALERFTTTEQPLVLVLEDLHWCDASTLDWLSYVIRRRDPARLFIIGTYRPVDAMAQAHPLPTVVQGVQRYDQCQVLHLDYLSEASVAAYLAHRFPTRALSEGMATLIHQRTRGNPLFMVTVVDDVVRRDDVFTTPLSVDALRVPESLAHLITQQIDQLPVEDRTLLEVASVAGFEFSAAALAAGVDRPADEIEARCTAFAHRRQFIRPVGMVEWPDQTLSMQYSFIHAFYQEVLYDAVPVSRRLQWHRQIGDRLESGYGRQAREIATELAMHFVQGREPLSGRYSTCIMLERMP